VVEINPLQMASKKARMYILVEGASDGMDEGLLGGLLDGDGPRVWFVGVHGALNVFVRSCSQ
jgi:hypothetical protein